MSLPVSNFSLDLPETPPLAFPAGSLQQTELERVYRALQILRLRVAELEARVSALDPELGA